MKRLRLATGVEEEIQSAARWYEDHEVDLGEALVSAVNATIEAVVHAPTRLPPLNLSGSLRFRRAKVSRFPYQVVFLETESEILVVAVAHERRRPGYWRDRLSSD